MISQYLLPDSTPAHEASHSLVRRDSLENREASSMAEDMAPASSVRREQELDVQAAADSPDRAVAVSRELALRQDLCRRGKLHRQTLPPTLRQWLRLGRQSSTTALE